MHTLSYSQPDPAQVCVHATIPHTSSQPPGMHANNEAHLALYCTLTLQTIGSVQYWRHSNHSLPKKYFSPTTPSPSPPLLLT